MAITYNDLFLDIRRELKKGGVIDTTLEARELVCFGVNKSREELTRDGRLYAPPELERRVRELTARHLAGEPVAYLIGEWEFYGLGLDISPAVLIPRPDTEVLVQTVVHELDSGADCRVLDLCAGSGCIGLAVASQVLRSRVLLGEWDEEALKVCRQNIRRNQLSVRDHEPHLALDGGADGLDFYRVIADKWRDALLPNGLMAFEVGIGQADEVLRIMRANGFGDIQIVKDLHGIPRVVYGRLCKEI